MLSRHRAKELLEIPNDPSPSLFFVDQWSEPYRGAYENAGTVEEKARVAYDYIHHCIAVDNINNA